MGPQVGPQATGHRTSGSGIRDGEILGLVSRVPLQTVAVPPEQLGATKLLPEFWTPAQRPQVWGILLGEEQRGENSLVGGSQG